MAHPQAPWLPPLAFARRMRRQMTPSEWLLWSRLRRHGVGVHFRRQHPLAGWTLDFVALGPRLVVEVDGTGHSELRDATRDSFLARKGFRVLRVRAWLVERHLDAVIEVIRAAL